MNSSIHLTMQQTNALAQQSEALRYAKLLDWSTRLGVLALMLSFSAYMFELLPPLVPLAQLPNLWNLPVSDYLHQTGTPTGWGWLHLVAKGDLSNLLGIAMLTGSSVMPLLGLVALYVQRKDHVYASICAVILLVLLLAASGVLTGGH